MSSEDVVELRLDEKNLVTIYYFGATVTSWLCDGKERLFVSSQAIYNKKKAIRGGIPVVFPNFGPWECGPQHGFARISNWTLVSPPTRSQTTEGEEVCAQLKLTDSADTTSMWNYQFELIYTVKLSRGRLVCSLSITNKGEETFDCTTLLHTYLRVDDVQKATVSNLSGLQYRDKLRGGEVFTEERDLVTAVGGADRVYMSTPSDHQVEGCVDGTKVIISKENLPDTVVWNPWQQGAKGMADFGDEEYKNMICVEPGYVAQPLTVSAGLIQTFTQTLNIMD